MKTDYSLESLHRERNITTASTTHAFSPNKQARNEWKILNAKLHLCDEPMKPFCINCFICEFKLVSFMKISFSKIQISCQQQQQQLRFPWNQILINLIDRKCIEANCG